MITAAVTPASMPRRIGADDAVAVDEVTVVFASGQLHELNASAATIWQACTGHVSIAAIASDLADRFGLASDRMESEIMDAARTLGERGLLDLTGDAPLASLPILEPVPLCGSCGDGPRYETQLVIDVGEAVLTIGMDRGLADPMATALRGHAIGVLDEPERRPSYGIVVPEAGRVRGAQEVSRLYRGPDILARSRRPQRVLDALVAQISHHRASGQTLLDALAVGDGARVVLVPPPPNPVGFERAVTRRGLAVGDLASVMIDDRHAAHIGAVDLDVDRAAIEAIAASRGDVGREPPPLRWGTYPIAGLAVRGVPTRTSAFSELGPLLAGEPASLASMLSLAAAVPIVNGVDVDTLARVLAP